MTTNTPSPTPTPSQPTPADPSRRATPDITRVCQGLLLVATLTFIAAAALAFPGRNDPADEFGFDAFLFELYRAAALVAGGTFVGWLAVARWVPRVAGTIGMVVTLVVTAPAVLTLAALASTVVS